MRPVRVLVVDDERLARVGLRRQLAGMDGVEIVGECADGPAAVRAIRDLEPDVVLLDIRMPGMDGFDVVREVGVGAMPPVVFVTAHDEHALRAFEMNAADYVLKPIEPARFEEAFRRAADRAARIRERPVAEDLRRLLRRLDRLEEEAAAGSARAGDEPTADPGTTQVAEAAALDRLAVEKAGRISFLDADEIRWIEAADNYARLHAGEESYLVRRTLKSLEADLDPESFLRVSRSAIVNMGRVEHLVPGDDERYRIHLDDGTRVVSSRRYGPAVREYVRRRR